MGMVFLYLYLKRLLKNCLKEHFSTIILLSINHRHTDSRMLLYIYCRYIFCMCVCVCVCVRMCFSFSSLLYIFS